MNAYMRRAMLMKERLKWKKQYLNMIRKILIR